MLIKAPLVRKYLDLPLTIRTKLYRGPFQAHTKRVNNRQYINERPCVIHPVGLGLSINSGDQSASSYRYLVFKIGHPFFPLGGARLNNRLCRLVLYPRPIN